MECQFCGNCYADSPVCLTCGKHPVPLLLITRRDMLALNASIEFARQVQKELENPHINYWPTVLDARYAIADAILKREQDT